MKKSKKPNTNQKAIIGLNCAGFWIRLAAKLIDGIILVSPLLIFYGTPSNWPDKAPVLYYAVIALFLVYDLVAVKKYGTTIGKRILNLRVISSSNAPIDWWRSLLRQTVYIFASSILALGVGSLFIAFNKRKQGIHDMAASTFVIRGN